MARRIDAAARPGERLMPMARSPVDVEQIAHRSQIFTVRSAPARLDLCTPGDHDRLDRTRKGKPLVREGRKATGLSEFAGPPK